jgi:protein O-mannosyl-transferase
MPEQDFSFKNLFVPLTTFKAIHWIIIVGLIVYGNMLFNSFVWDDNTYILDASVVHTFNISSFFGFNVFNNAGQYRPLTVTYFAMLYNLFGSNQFFFHCIQLLLHIINSCLLFLLFKSFFDKKLSLFLTLIFLVHPMQVESVSYIASSTSPLFFLFGMIALIIGKYKKNNQKNSALQFLLLLCSTLVKETGILFSPVLVSYKFLLKKKNITRDIIYSCLIFIIYFFIRTAIGNVSIINRPLLPIGRLSLVERLLTMPQVIFYYIKIFFYPVTLAINQQWVITQPTFSNFYFPFVIDLLFFMTIFAIGYIFYKKRKKMFAVYLFFFVWYLLGLTIHAQIIPLDFTVADRWIYFGMAGLLGLSGVIIQGVSNKVGRYTKLAFVLAGIIILLLFSIRTIVRNNDWRTPVNLWTHDIQVSDNYLSEEELSIALFKEKKLNDALIPAQKSIASFSNDLNYYNLGYIYETMGKIPQAKQAYMNAYHAKNYLPWNHRHYLALYVSLGKLLLYYDDPKDANTFINDALTDYPDSADLYFFLAVSEYKLHNHDKAITAIKQALTLSPENNNYQNFYQRLINNQPVDIQIKNPVAETTGYRKL